ncbi:MAG: DNA recombination protein RmuC [Bacteroides sp.]|nr:DNA recombination protein RmuC [Bacillota bacterium]MCM1393605.1 DNA recombination protein RmuC [[Eubacterium] siraeum]MCM1455817.1 DNA recombination protein RmuC [Bacteroides sp.]
MTGVYVLLSLCLVVGIAAVGVGVFVLKKLAETKKSDLTAENIREENYRLIEAVDQTVRMNNSMLVGPLNVQNDNNKQLQNQFNTFMISTDNKLNALREDLARSLNDVKNSTANSLKEVRDDNARNLAEIKKDNAEKLERVRSDNEKQLEKMRETVDEKLSSTLDQRFNQSFKIVNDRLEEINRTFGELQNLQTGVRDLNNIFKNVKTRGTWGEVALDSLLSQILVQSQYEKQVRLTRGSEDAVDFAIKMPGKGDGEVLLPIDAKFPMEDYERLVAASQNADANEAERAGKALAARIKQEAMSIRDKYVKPPKTTDFAIMYLPTEGLFAEIVKRDGLMETLQNHYRVVVCGPTTLAALLNSLQMGFKSVAIEKRSTEIGKLLNSFIGDFGKFSKLLQQTGDKLQNVQNTLANAEKRTELIQKKLDKVRTFAGDELLVDGEEQELIEGETLDDDDDMDAL